MSESSEAFSSASPALQPLMAAIGEMHEGLKNLPDASHDDYYARLGGTLAERLPPLYHAYDAWLAAVLEAEGRKITCSRGCDACCRHFVSSVEPFELVALDRHVKTRADYGELVVSSYRRAAIYEKILRAENEAGDDEEAEDRALYRYFTRGHACVFLNADGTCGVYDWRPMSCRMFYAESSPRFCTGKYLASPWNKNFQVELPLEAEEALARCSRLLESLDLSENLFTGLVDVNALFGQHDVVAGENAPANRTAARKVDVPGRGQDA